MRVSITVITLLLFASLTSSVFAAKPSRPSPAPTPTPSVKSVCIDAGHGGSEIGTSNLDLLEKNVNLDVAQLLKGKLMAAGYEVFMTREDDRELSNADRYTYCNSHNATILVSIHHNGSADTGVDYSLGLYMKKSDIALAQHVVDSVSYALNLPNNGISRFASGVLLKSEMPSTISEGFFLTNNNEYALVKSGVRQEQEAEALLTAINHYFN